jgi:hypothetical protein
MSHCARRDRTRALRAALGAAALSSLGACTDGAAVGPHEPLLLIGIDGLDPGVCAELMAEGRLPNLQRLATRGVVARLETFAPTYSPVVWTSIATGQVAEAHGIDYFCGADGLPYTSNCRRVPALWNLAGDAGLIVDCAGWWVTWPAEPIRGRMLATYAAQAQGAVVWKQNVWRELPEQTWPRELFAEIEPLLTFAAGAAGGGSEEQVYRDLWTVFPRPDDVLLELPPVSRLVQDLAWSHSSDRSVAAVARHFLATGRADLTLVYLGLPDVAGHRFWRYYRPADFPYPVGDAVRAALGDYVALAYAEADRILGELVAAAPAGSNVVVLSDHGMHADPETLSDPTALTSGHHKDAPDGLIAACGPAFRQLGVLINRTDGRRVGHVLGVAPLAMRLLGLAAPEHWPYAGAARGSAAFAELLEPEWSREHPPRTCPSTEAGFRPASAARDPGAGLDELFMSWLDDVGYLSRSEDG